GATGLTAAARLAQLGVAHVVVDADAGPARESRATLVHAATLEILDELGVADELIAAGIQINRIGFSDRGRVIARIGLAGVPTRYPYALGVPQSTTERVLAARLAPPVGSIRRGHRAEKVAPVPEGYLVTGTGPAGAGAARFGISARYVIGCDGAHSIVRSSAGLDFPGGSYRSQFVLADAELRAAPGPDDEARIFTSPTGWWLPGGYPAGTTASSRPWTLALRCQIRPAGPSSMRSCASAALASSLPTRCGRRGSGCTTASPTGSAPAMCSCAAMPRACTARRGARAGTPASPTPTTWPPGWPRY